MKQYQRCVIKRNMLLLASFNVVQSFPVCIFLIPCAMCAQESEGHKNIALERIHSIFAWSCP
jgi:hypothetical protein